MVGLAEALVLFSEVTLASYPILIKQVDTNLWTQIVSRMGVYGALSLLVLLISKGQLSSISPISLAGGGILNLMMINLKLNSW